MKRILITINMMLVAIVANSQSCPDNNHPHAIDLGLPSGTKWACCNVGANSPEGYGSYYAWGETKVKDVYDWNTYIHCDGSKETCLNIGSDIEGSEYDVAHVQWDGSWMMPSQAQILELVSKCQYTWTRKNGVSGELFKGPNGGTIFLPEADFWRENSRAGSALDCDNDGLNKETDELPCTGYYWSSTQSSSKPDCANCLFFSNTFVYGDSQNYRCTGLTVRPVMRRPPADVNSDNIIDISDIVAVINVIAGTDSNEKADVNGDGTADISDIVAVINSIAK